MSAPDPPAPDPGHDHAYLTWGLLAATGGILLFTFLLFFSAGDDASLVVLPSRPDEAETLNRQPAQAPPRFSTAPAPPVPGAPPTIDESRDATVGASPDVERRVPTPHEPTIAGSKLAPDLDPGPVEVPAPQDRRSRQARRLQVRRFGGTPASEDAVEAGLAWLAAHQSPPGYWDRFAFGRQCPADDRCLGPAIRRTNVSLRPGLTALCALAFVGAGYSHEQGPYQQNVTAALRYLLGEQQPEGGFGRDLQNATYNDALPTFALAELLSLTGDSSLRPPLERAVKRVVSAQQPLGGWDYLPVPTSGRNDTSITAWAVQALLAASAAGIEVPPETLVRAALHFTRATEPDGRVWYADAGTGTKIDDNLQLSYRYGPAMIAATLTAQQLLGWRVNSPVGQQQEALLFADPPSASAAQGRDPTQLHAPYYWYYGSIATFQRGGDAWNRWHNRLRDAILPLQNRETNARGDRDHAYGSWQPYGPNWGKWGRIGSRVYTTAICTLTLEVYYRHTPAYLVHDAPLSADHWRAALANYDADMRRLAVRCLENARLEVGEPVLVELLADPAPRVALDAAHAVTRLDSPLGIPILEANLPALPAFEQALARRSLEYARALLELAPATGRIRLYDPELGLATAEINRAYVGMLLTARRDDRTIAHLRVKRRFTDRDLVIVKEGERSPAVLLRAGDALVSEAPEFK